MGAAGVPVVSPVVSVFVRDRSVSGVVTFGDPLTPRSDGVLLGSGSPPPLAITTIKSRNTTAPATTANSRRRL